MKRIILILIPILAVFLLAPFAGAGTVSIVTKETVKEWMDQGSVTILDARQGRDWTSSEFKIKGAVRTAPGDLASWKGNFTKDQKLAIYCA